MDTSRNKLPAVNRSRAGITILETMIAIGVASIGVFGVFAMLPVASHQSQQGLIADHKSFLGQNAFQELELRGGSHPGAWLYTQLTPDEQPPMSGNWVWLPSYAPVRDPGTYPRAPHVPPATSFCIDPRYFSNVPAPPGMGPPQTFGFPDVATAPLQMRRISLQAVPGTNVGMPGIMADEVFVSDDDLNFKRTDDVLVTAAQQYLWAQGPDGEWGAMGVDDDSDGNIDNSSEAGWPGSDDVPAKRESGGAYSWMATVVPKFVDPNYSVVFIDPMSGQLVTNGARRTTDLYTLSIVVYYHREVAEPGSERIANVVLPFNGGGVGGGDVTISGATPADVNVKQGDWVMLSQAIPTRQFGVNPMDPTQRQQVTIPAHHWYRVISADTDQTDSLTTRNITLAGHDIDPNRATQVTIAIGVVAVYEKTIRLESSSLWIP